MYSCDLFIFARWFCLLWKMMYFIILTFRGSLWPYSGFLWPHGSGSVQADPQHCGVPEWKTWWPATLLSEQGGWSWWRVRQTGKLSYRCFSALVCFCKKKKYSYVLHFFTLFLFQLWTCRNKCVVHHFFNKQFRLTQIAWSACEHHLSSFSARQIQKLKILRKLKRKNSIWKVFGMGSWARFSDSNSNFLEKIFDRLKT